MRLRFLSPSVPPVEMLLPWMTWSPASTCRKTGLLLDALKLCAKKTFH
jgi:hypothetical protein